LSPPKNVTEARNEAIAFILAICDQAKVTRPSAGVTPAGALAAFAQMIEKVAADHYGEDWHAVVAKVRDHQRAESRQAN
jgi:hypothetical protein